jgi:hypothetical protein
MTQRQIRTTAAARACAFRNSLAASDSSTLLILLATMTGVTGLLDGHATAAKRADENNALVLLARFRSHGAPALEKKKNTKRKEEMKN